MNEQQVDILRLQLAQALVDALGGLFLASIGYPHLRHEEQVFAPDATLTPGIAHAFFIEIGLSRINQTIANAQRITYATFTLLR